MRRFIKSVAILLFAIFIVFYLLDLLFTDAYKKGSYFKTQWIYSMTGLHYDYAVLGASRSLTAIDMKVANAKSGLNGINLSLDGTLPTTQYLILKIFLEHGNSTDHLILNVNPWQIGIDSISHFSFPRFLPFVHDSIVFNFFVDYDKEWIAYKYIPFYRYAKYNFDWGIGMYLNTAFSLVKPDYDKYGSFFYPFTNYVGSKSKYDYLFDMSNDFKNLKLIIELCKEYDIRLTVIFLPVVNLNYNHAYQDNAGQFRNFLKGYGVEYIEYRDTYNGQYELFTDENHFNRYGVEKYTQEHFLDLLQ